VNLIETGGQRGRISPYPAPMRATYSGTARVEALVGKQQRNRARERGKEAEVRRWRKKKRRLPLGISTSNPIRETFPAAQTTLLFRLPFFPFSRVVRSPYRRSSLPPSPFLRPLTQHHTVPPTTMPDVSSSWKRDLETHGYSVVRSTVPRERADAYTHSAKSWAQNFGWKEDDRSTWREGNLPVGENGLVNLYGVSHEDWVWKARLFVLFFLFLILFNFRAT
jgi:hypothetical protein